MDAQEIQQKAIELMLSMVNSDPAKAKADFQALKQAAAQLDADLPEEMSEAMSAMELMIEMLATQSYDVDLVQSTLPDFLKEPSEPEPEIFDAIDDGDVEAVKAALAEWDINARHGQFSKTALYQAVSGFGERPLEMANLLLDHGADPCKGLAETGVLHGLGFGRWSDEDPAALAEFVRRCVALGADIEEASDRLQWTPLMTALNEWETVSVEALLMAGADPNAKAGSENNACTRGQSCLEMALCQPKLVELLLRFDADPDLCQVEAKLRNWRASDSEFEAELAACQTLLDARRRPN